MNITKRKNVMTLTAFSTAMMLFFALVFTLDNINQPAGEIIRWSSKIGDYIRLEKPQSVEYHGVFSFDGINDTLVFQKVIATRMDIFINGKYITTFGDGTGNLWPDAITLRIPNGILKKDGKNIIKVMIYGIVGVGIYGKPYVTTLHNAKVIAGAINVFRNSISLVGIGASAMILYLLLIALESAREIERRVYLNIIIASVFMILSLLQFVYRESSGSSVVYLILEQFARTSPIFVLTFLIFATIELTSLQAHFKNGFKTFTVLLPTTLTSIMIYSTKIKFIHILAEVADIYAVMLLALIVFIVARYRVIEFVFPVTFMLLTGLQTFYVLMAKRASELTIHYGRIVFLVYVGMTTLGKFKELSEKHENLKKENLIDHLTGVMNRKAIDMIPKGGTLVLMDLDGFKLINDKYGHIEGDKLLKKFAGIISSNIRTGDYFIRLGGDEFCIVFKTVDQKDIPKVMERLYNECRNQIGIGFSYGYGPFDNFDTAYDIADKMMYEKKNLIHKSQKR